MANNAKTFTEYTACTNPQATDVLILTSNVSGNNLTLQVSVANLRDNASANLSSNITTTTLLNVTDNSTPANNSDIPTGITAGGLWSDGTYIYYYNGTEIKRTALSTF